MLTPPLPTPAVFPAQAGVIPEIALVTRNIVSIPRASGGDPPVIHYGCFFFVFPAQAGVIPTINRGGIVTEGIPRASGGDPRMKAYMYTPLQYSRASGGDPHY